MAHARAEVSEVVHRSPRLFGHERSRWWLAGIRRGLEWLSGLSLPGVWKLLRRLKVHYKRGRQYVHSPDPDYDTKLAAIAAATAVVRQEPTAYVLLYEDELTYYRRPSLACAYGLAGHDDVRAQSEHRSASCPTASAAWPPVSISTPGASCFSNAPPSAVVTCSLTSAL